MSGNAKRDSLTQKSEPVVKKKITPETQNTAGRDISFHTREFTSDESNFFLYRTVFLYVCFGIPGIETMLGVSIDGLLNKNGTITDEQVKKMIWVVCNFNHYLSIIRDEDDGTFIQHLSGGYATKNPYTRNPHEIAKSIATLVVRVFTAFKLKINQGRNVQPVEAYMPLQEDYVGIEDDVAVIGEINSKLDSTKVETDKRIDDRIKEINDTSPDTPNRTSNRVRLFKQALEAAVRAKNEAAVQRAAAAAEAKQRKIQDELKQLRECSVQLSQTIKFIQACNITNFKYENSIKFDNKFLNLLPKVLARMISCIKRRIETTDIKPGPGTAETLNSLGLPDPSIKIRVDDEDGGASATGSSGGSRRFGITKRKKNNKILRRWNSKIKKGSQKIWYGGGRAGVRHIVEHTQPIPQCEHTIGNYHEYVKPTCYICGEPWIEQTQQSMECEHILCVIHGIEYYGLLQSVFLSEDHKQFLTILYAWAHHCCNQKKRNTAFIRKNTRADPAARNNYFVPDDVNIRELLSDIYTLSTIKEGSPKAKHDCNKILKKVKDTKKQFVDKRTAVVTSYVTPLVACINNVFTGVFQENMVLFNAIGCLKIIAEMSIYLTGAKNDSLLQLDLDKTATFMHDVVFPGCALPAERGARGGRRIIHDKKTRKSMRRKIQRGGTQGEIIDAISRLLEQEEYETQIGYFKNAVGVFVENPEKNPNSSRMLSDTLNQMFPGPPLLIEESSEPTPNLETPLAQIEDPTKMNAILFILFVLNHSRNPTILLDLFLDLKEQARIVGEQTTLAQAEPDSPGITLGAVVTNITQSFEAYQSKRRVNKTAFINICSSVFDNEATITSITVFLAACDMMPSFVGVVMFCARQSDFASITDTQFKRILSKCDINGNPRFRENVKPTLEKFQTIFLQNPTLYGDLFANSVAAPETPLDHLVNACYHLKQIKLTDQQHYITWLLDACCLFPSCFDHEDIFSQFGPCDAYGDGVLKNHHFQAALGCVASAKTMCARILINGKSATPSTHSPDVHQTAALELFSNFFDEEDRNILSNLYKPAPAMPTLQRGVEGGPATQYTGIVTERTIDHAIQTFGSSANYDADNFVNIIIGLMWEINMVEKDSIPSIDFIRNYILENISNNPEEFAKSIASYLNKNRGRNQRKIIAGVIYDELFPIISRRLPEQDGKNTPQPDTVKKQQPPPRGDLPQLPLFQSEPVNGPPSQHEVVNRVCGFVEKLVEENLSSESQESQDSRVKLLFNINQGFRFGSSSSSSVLTYKDMVHHLTNVITLLLPQQSTPSSPSSGSDESQEQSAPQRQPDDIAIEILSTYNYFQDESFDEDDIKYVFNYIMEPDPRITLKEYITQKKPFKRQRNGGSSSHHTKRQHQKTRCKKPKIKSRRKNRNS